MCTFRYKPISITHAYVSHHNIHKSLAGKMISSGARSPRAFMRVYSISAVVSISSCPVRNTRMSPAGSDRWICITGGCVVE